MKLRFFTWVARAAGGRPIPWADMIRVPLAQIHREVEAHPALGPLGDYLNVCVRNALAHGRTDWDRVERVCKFHDRRQTVKWSCGEFWERTERLLKGTAAIAVLEPLVHKRMLVWIANAMKEVAPESPN
jgi:hypothetical protein